MQNMDPKSFVYGLSAIAAAIAVFVGIGAAIATGKATEKAIDAVARQPEAGGAIQRMLIIGSAFSEATAIYGLLVAILLILVKIF
jgi:F-type H+-transporting ATPase subunit c